MIITVRCLFEAHLAVADLDQSIAFYRDVVGLKLAHVTAARQAAFFWWDRPGKRCSGLWSAGSAPQKTTTHIAFGATLDDVVAAPRAMRSFGVTPLNFEGQPTDEPVVLAWMPAASIYFRDPDGHLLEYLAMLSDRPRPDAGVLPWSEWQLAREDSGD